jgi:hypothetical protein
MTYRLFLDDQECRQIGGDWVYVRSSAEAIAIVSERGMPVFMQLDHDLGGDDTTMVFLWWLVDYALDRGLPFDFDYHVHSQDPPGRDNIIGLIEGFKRAHPSPGAHGGR